MVIYLGWDIMTSCIVTKFHEDPIKAVWLRELKHQTGCPQDCRGCSHNTSYFSNAGIKILLTSFSLSCITYPFPNSFILWQLHNGFNIFISETAHSQLVVFLGDEVCLYDCSKHWESVVCVERAIVVIVVHTCHFLQIFVIWTLIGCKLAESIGEVV